MSLVSNQLHNSPMRIEWIIHGALMWLSVSVIFPVGVVFACYTRSQSLWFHTHWISQVLAASLMGASLAIALTQFHALLSVHSVVGLVVVSLVVLQLALGGIFRPQLGGWKRPIWNTWHSAIGLVIIILGTSNVAFGLKLLNDKSHGNLLWAYWAFCAQILLLSVVFAVLEWRRLQKPKGEMEPITPSPPGGKKAGVSPLPIHREPPSLQMVVSVSRSGREWTRSQPLETVDL